MSQTIQITVQRGNEQHDIDVAPEMTIESLCTAVVQAYGWDKGPGGAGAYRLQHVLENRWLTGTETLMQARVWTGALITFHAQRVQRSSAAPAPASPVEELPLPPAEPANEGPLVGWRQVDEQPSSPDGEQDSHDNRSNGYAWKRLD
jgi:hypothetical protein